MATKLDGARWTRARSLEEMIERIGKEDERREKKVVVPPVDQHLYAVVGRVAIERHAHLQGLVSACMSVTAPKSSWPSRTDTSRLCKKIEGEEVGPRGES